MMSSMFFQCQADQVGKSGQVLAACGRPTFSENVVNKNYYVRYRNAENKNKLGWRLVGLGRAGAIVAIAVYGFHVSLEDNAEIDLKHIFLSAAYYALMMRYLKLWCMSLHDEKSLNLYLKGFVQAALRIYKSEAAHSARKVWQNKVFGQKLAQQ
jgi:hypothetical protein